MDILGKLLGGIPRVKIMRLFLLNPDQGFESADVSDRSRLQTAITRRTITGLVAMGLVHKRSFMKEVTMRNGKIRRKRVQGYFLRNDFPYIRELKQLLVEGDYMKHDELARRFRPAGRIHLLVVSGVFVPGSETKLDVLIVGDNLRKSYVQKTISVLESELGRELSYAMFDTADFRYRVSMYDKLLRDVFDYPHEELIATKDFASFAMKS